GPEIVVGPRGSATTASGPPQAQRPAVFQSPARVLPWLLSVDVPTVSSSSAICIGAAFTPGCNWITGLLLISPPKPKGRPGRHGDASAQHAARIYEDRSSHSGRLRIG